MSDRITLRARLACVSTLVLAAALMAPAITPAGAAVPTPDSATNCFGAVKPDSAPTADDPNLLDYSFHCDGPITAYTVLINRQGHAFDGIDDFDPSPSALFPDGTLIGSESIACSGVLPGDGINCNAGAGGEVAGYATLTGHIDTSDPFCANLPKKAKPGQKPEPSAVAQLVVTDITGAEDGPFRLPMQPACKPVKAIPKPKPATRTAKRLERTAARAHH